jgi:hypothetical protein
LFNSLFSIKSKYLKYPPFDFATIRFSLLCLRQKNVAKRILWFIN